MIHFVRQIQYYCHLEVMECSWQSLEQVFQKKEGDLDSLIEAHRSYLDTMVNKALLLSSKAGKEVRVMCPFQLHCCGGLMCYFESRRS